MNILQSKTHDSKLVGEIYRFSFSEKKKYYEVVATWSADRKWIST